MPDAWVLVTGMHRSGTSAMAGVLHSLGLALPADLLIGGTDNRSHNESGSLTRVNDALFDLLGGTWDNPPVLEPRWESRADIAATVPTVSRATVVAFPTATPAVLKDPRMSLLLPYWTRVISPIAGVVLIWRSPMAVARSLMTRDAIPIDRGLALWCRYNGEALRQAAPFELLVVDYDELIEDPLAVSRSAKRWLERVVPTVPVVPNRAIAAAKSVRRSDRHEFANKQEAPLRCKELTERLSMMRGPHGPTERAGARMMS